MFWVWFAAITLATIAGIVVCVTQVINSIEIMKHKKRTWLDFRFFDRGFTIEVHFAQRCSQ
nr:MAG TPA: hypothetical protein [Caudoviricetes sp.]